MHHEGYPKAAPKAICPGCGHHFLAAEMLPIESEELIAYFPGKLVCPGCYAVAA